jgi:hypothetical protein
MRAPDLVLDYAGLADLLHLIVVRYMTARCTYSESAAEFPLKVARLKRHRTGRLRTRSGAFILTTSPICPSFALATPDQPL